MRHQQPVVKVPLQDAAARSVGWLWDAYRVVPRSCVYWENRQWWLERRTIWDTLFLVVVRGQLGYQIGSFSGTASAGETLVIPPRVDHELRQVGSGPLHQFALHADIDDAFGQPWAVSATAQWGTGAVPVPDLDQRAPAWHRVCALIEHDQTCGRLALGAEVRSLLTALLCTQPALEPPDHRAGDQIMRSVAQQAVGQLARDWSIGDLADLAGLGEVQFRKRFRRELGQSPLAWLNTQRLAAASQRLLTTLDSVAAVARAVGFSDPDYFRRVFHRQRGCTPSEWRTRRDV